MSRCDGATAMAAARRDGYSMKSVTIKQRLAVFGVFGGLLAAGCSSDSDEKTPAVVSEPMGPASGASGGAGTSSTPAAGSGTGAAGQTSPATGAAGMSAAAGRNATPPPTTAAGSGGTPAAGSGASAGAPAAGRGGASGAPAPAAGTGGGAAPVNDEPFSFFVTSWAAMQRLSKSPNGFGGDLRYGESDGLKGADKICTEIAETASPGSGSKGWRAFLSVTKGPDGQPVHAIDRVGQGPWYDRQGRLLAMNKADLMQQRPKGADPAIINDFPNEDGVPNHAPDGKQVDNHDILTGTGANGQLFNADWKYTCHDWTSSVGADGTPRVGHSWPRMGGSGFPGGGGGGGFVPPPGGGGGPGGGGFPGGGTGPIDLANWMSSLNEAGCAAGASLVEMGPPIASNPTVGSGGGYGGIYCFALKP